MIYIYQETRQFFAQVAHGLEEEGVAELAELGATELRVGYRGVHFTATQEVLYRINYHTRLITRVLAPISRFTCHNPKYLYRKANAIPWTDFLSPDQTFAVFANVSHSKIRHSQYAALCVKDAVVDYFREQTGQRPNIERHNPDLWINVHLENNQATLSVDTSGGSLHRRGYRVGAHEAPIQETVAAAMIRLSGWHGERPLYDPMCGSGTLLAEALMHAQRLPAGCLRPHFGFEQLPDFDPASWCRIREEADAQIREVPQGLIAGSDLDPTAIEAARGNLNQLAGHKAIALKTKDFRQLPALNNTTIICNPPYGLRIGARNMGAFYRDFGDFLKQKCTGSTAYIYFGKRIWIKHLGLRTSWKKPLVNGALDGRLVKYEIY